MKKPTLKPGAVAPLSRRDRVKLRRKQAAAAPASNEVEKIIVEAPVPPLPSLPLSAARHPSGLIQQELLFVQHYMIDPNATQAAKKAGYSAKSAGTLGARLLQKVSVAAEIRKRMDRRAEKYEISADRALLEVARLCFADMGNYMRADEDGMPRLDFSELTADHRAALQEVTVEEFKDGRSDKREVRRTKFKLAPKAPLLDLMFRHLGLVTEKAGDLHLHGGSAMARLFDEIDRASRGPIIKTIDHDSDEPRKAAIFAEPSTRETER